jgi:H+/gluconate symporter-like permease
MRKLIRLSIALVAAGSGALLGVFIAGAYVSATYACSPQPGDPCDAGAMVGFGLMLILSPALGLICGGLAYWAWGHRRLTA